MIAVDKFTRMPDVHEHRIGGAVLCRAAVAGRAPHAAEKRDATGIADDRTLSSGFTPQMKNQYMPNRYALIALIAAVVIAADQITKALVFAAIPLHTEIPVISGMFNLVHVHNRGAAFGFLNRHDISWQFWLFLAATVIAAVVIVILARNARRTEYGFFTALGLIFGGAAGNLIDRVRYRAVVDFLDFYWGNWHWPAFNVADIAICCGAVLATLVSWQRGRIREKE